MVNLQWWNVITQSINQYKHRRETITPVTNALIDAVPFKLSIIESQSQFRETWSLDYYHHSASNIWVRYFKLSHWSLDKYTVKANFSRGFTIITCKYRKTETFLYDKILEMANDTYHSEYTIKNISTIRNIGKLTKKNNYAVNFNVSKLDNVSYTMYYLKIRLYVWSKQNTIWLWITS
jgi:hypothetical protein